MKKNSFLSYFIKGLVIIFIVFMLLTVVSFFVSDEVNTVLSYIKIIGGILGVFASAIVSVVLYSKNK